MKITGIICEYNPLHLGHRKQMETIRAAFGEDSAIVCLMSGNYVQRGAPAIIEKSHRAKAAVLCGADLVLELPVTYALSSAEGFAAGGVSILSSFCHSLCFGAETADRSGLLSAASALLREDFPEKLRQQLETGLSFPSAREAAMREMGVDTVFLRSPNNILALEYCKAILAQNSAMEPMPILRGGDYHNTAPDADNPSATAVRQRMLGLEPWECYVPPGAAATFKDAPLHCMDAAERAILARLRTMTDADFESLPYGSEGLWRKFMHACRAESSVQDILSAVKSKRYTRSRLDRMLMCAFLGITREDILSPAPYCRVLAFNDRGRQVLKEARNAFPIVNTGQRLADPYQILEDRCGSLYGLFSLGPPEPPDLEARCRVYYHKQNNSFQEELS